MTAAKKAREIAEKHVGPVLAGTIEMDTLSANIARVFTTPGVVLEDGNLHWGRTTPGEPDVTLLDGAMGREYRTNATDTASSAVRTSRTGKDHKGRPHTSLFVKAGTCGVRNNEMIVWDSPAIKITYLVEFAK